MPPKGKAKTKAKPKAKARLGAMRPAPGRRGGIREDDGAARRGGVREAVSYTHLTLPTILLV
eukprot:3515725-Amphidinium_carterae.1